MIYLFAFNFTRPQAWTWPKTIKTKTFQLPWSFLPTGNVDLRPPYSWAGCFALSRTGQLGRTG